MLPFLWYGLGVEEVNLFSFAFLYNNSTVSLQIQSVSPDDIR